MRDDGSASFWIDHFLCSDSLTPLFDAGSNLSDHQPVFDYSLSAQLIPPKSPRSSVNNDYMGSCNIQAHTSIL